MKTSCSGRYLNSPVMTRMKKTEKIVTLQIMISAGGLAITILGHVHSSIISQGSSIEKANVVHIHILQRHMKLPSLEPGGRRGLLAGIDEGIYLMDIDFALIAASGEETWRLRTRVSRR